MEVVLGKGFENRQLFWSPSTPFEPFTENRRWDGNLFEILLACAHRTTGHLADMLPTSIENVALLLKTNSPRIEDGRSVCLRSQVKKVWGSVAIPATAVPATIDKVLVHHSVIEQGAAGTVVEALVLVLIGIEVPSAKVCSSRGRSRCLVQ